VSTEEEPFKYAIALTGGIATGKSTVSKLFIKEGFTVIDADRIAHHILHEATVEVAELFGNEILENGSINRKALGAIVFKDTKKRRSLEALIHPLIYDEILRLSEIEDRKRSPYLIDIPLFFETARYNTHKVIVVYATLAQQIERAIQRDRLPIEEVERRIAAQLPIEEKRNRATYLIDNSGDRAQLLRESMHIIKEIKKDFS